MARSPLHALFTAALVVVGVYLLAGLVPLMGFIDAPLSWLATFAHEGGHGLAGVAVGLHFDSFVLHLDGSGVARISGARTPTMQAAISAGGLVGPAVLAALLFAVGTRARVARVALAVLGLVMLAAAALVVRNAFGLIFTITTGALLVVAARKLSDLRAQTLTLFLAIQLALSVFSNSDYLFTDVAKTSSGDLPSDVAQMATALGGTYWGWGVLVAGVSVFVVVSGLGFIWLVDALHRRRRD